MYTFTASEVQKRLNLRRISLRGLAQMAHVDFKTARKASRGLPVNEGSAIKILDALGDDLTVNDGRKDE
ncbi:MAG: hypothetical protein IJP62_11300 [Treponema sp.]|nr:hypothetical protein [Treponema sp.]